jgi:biopolymer transport protein ExbD
MAPKNLDVWLVASNTVYKGVPFSVAASWAEQGRIAKTDKVRPAGGANDAWTPVSKMESLADYLFGGGEKKVETGDLAESLEKVEIDPAWPKSIADDDDDVDMIPLIDISLVLLIFFMMTATVAIGGSKIETPQTLHGVEFTQDKSMIWVGVDRGDDGKPTYSIGQGDMQAESADSQLSQDQMLAKLDAKLREFNVGLIVRIAGHKQLPYGVMQKLTAELEKRRRAGKISEIKAEVNEKST